MADPAIIRGLDVGQVAYIYRGGVTYVQVKRLVAAPAAVPGRARRQQGPVDGCAAGVSARTRLAQTAKAPVPARAAALPGVSAVLDAAFGPEPPASPRRAGESEIRP